jgi:hypothetical protein
MHTVELLEEAIALAKRLGYGIREEWLGGSGGGGCEIKGRKWIFLDMALPLLDQLDTVLDTLRRDPGALGLPMHYRLRELLQVRKTA